jgi:FkbM family methyltransferase
MPKQRMKTTHQFGCVILVILVIITVQITVWKFAIDTSDERYDYLQDCCADCKNNINFNEKNYLNKTIFQRKEYQHPTIPEIAIAGTIYTILSNGTYPFYVLSKEKKFPRADGDESQQHLIDRLKLGEKCKENPNTVIVDIGGFYGDFGLRAAAMGCKVYIFEPTPFQYWLIRASIDLNGFSDRVKLFNYAISSERNVVLFRDKGGQTEQVPVDTTGNNLFVIETTTLDSIIPEGEIFLLKTDVEGYESTVLFGGCAEILKNNRVRHIISEYTPWWNSGGKGPWNDFMDRMQSFGNSRTKVYALHRNLPAIYGPISKERFKEFHNHHSRNTLQTDLYFDMYGETSQTGILPWNINVYA